VIDGWLTEINVTSPIGIRAIKNVGGPDVAAMIWDRIEAKGRTASYDRFNPVQLLPMCRKLPVRMQRARCPVQCATHCCGCCPPKNLPPVHTREHDA
jgi:hypothetical protein